MTDKREPPFSADGDHISVCICTYKRAEMLARGLREIIRQETEGRFSFEVIVVDNDRERSAENVVSEIQNESDVRIVYDCEPEQNISLARNRCVQNATGHLIAFIDDDEIPGKEWLQRLYSTMRAIEADGVLGPVLPYYPPGAPEWLKKGNIFDRRRFATGTRLRVRDTRTGNVLFKREIFVEGSNWFDPAFGRTGGEDVDFFERQLVQGRTFAWCDEAIAHETIPPERWKASFHFRKYFRIGTLNGERLRKSGVSGIMGLLRTIASVPSWLLVLVAFLPFGKHLWIRPALKVTYSGGGILAYCGMSFVRQRD